MTENSLSSDAGAASTYDAVPYDGTHVLTHPFRLETNAHLLGVAAPPVTNCRVLELGSAKGSNLLNQAASLPGASFLGIDLSQRQIDEGRRALAAAELTNVELRQANILEIDASWGQFDYIICHGVYSWVPAEVRDKILSVCQQNLAPQGLALVSYNIFPGWHLKRMLRDAVLYHTADATDPKQQIAGAKQILKFMAEMHPKDSFFGQLFRRTLGDDLSLLAPDQEFYLFHDLMEIVNEPCLFHEFAAAAGAKGLQYVADANALQSSDSTVPAKIRQSLDKLPLIRKEQYKDFLFNRTFRSSLLCHADVTLDRKTVVSRIRDLHVALAYDVTPVPLDIRHDRPDEIKLPHGKMTIRDRVAKAAFMYLKEIYPRFVSFDELRQTAESRVAACGVHAPEALERAGEKIASTLLTGFVAGVCELCLTPPQWCLEISERPSVSALTRFNAQEGRLIANPLQTLAPWNPPTRYLMQHLDGQHDVPALAKIIAEAIQAGKLSVKSDSQPVRDLNEISRQFVTSALQRIARAGLLVS